MKKLTKLFALCLALALCLSLLPAAHGATAPAATIDTSRKASLDLYKYDFTSANEAGILEWDTYVSTGLVFSYVKVADITTYSALEADGYRDMVLYGMEDHEATTQLLTALGLTAADAYRTEHNTLYFVSDVLVDALAAKLTENTSNLKNALEKFVADQGGVDLSETDEAGHSGATGLDLGLYLVVETYVPENVYNTTAPFFVSLPMTTIDGQNWNYDVTVYPKNETDMPTLEKTLRESTLPTITSNATALTTYTFVDTLSKGIAYNKQDVKLEWFQDAACTQKVTEWDEASGKFAVAYGTADHDSTTMTISMTASGLDEINNATTVYDSTSLYRGYSACTVRITYACTVNSSADVVYGDGGNPNEVQLTWKRTNTDYYDTLEDDCHFYTYGLDLTKKFNDSKGNFSKVQFVMHNDTDNYWVKAQLNEAEGVYYVTEHVAEEANATKFVPVSAGGQPGKVIVKGLEDDAYTITEVATDAGYTLLKDSVKVVITTKGDGEICPICGKEGVTATATVNGDAVAMTDDGGSLSAVVPLTVVNTKGFDLPKTGDHGTWMFAVGGSVLICMALVCIVLVAKRKKSTW